ncbi:hypothetical protein PFISCL1PPCAC_28132, partial [Pristionchus fissidentatus]
DLRVAVVELSLVGSLIIFQLVVKILELLLEQCVSSFHIGQLTAEVGSLCAQSLDLVFLMLLLHVLTRRLRLNLLDLDLVPRIHFVAVSVGHLIVLCANVADGVSEFVLEEL